MQSAGQPVEMKVSANQARFLSWSSDVLVYTIVLNLFVQYYDPVVIDSFSISILTAVLLRAMLELIKGLEHGAGEFWKQREGMAARVLGPVSVFAILFLGKFAILEVVDLVFGDHVELGHFVDVLVLILALIISRSLFDFVYKSLGSRDPAE